MIPPPERSTPGTRPDTCWARWDCNECGKSITRQFKTHVGRGIGVEAEPVIDLPHVEHGSSPYASDELPIEDLCLGRFYFTVAGDLAHDEGDPLPPDRSPS